MAIFAMTGIILGIIMIVISASAKEGGGYWLWSIAMLLGSCIVGAFGTPSKGSPNGEPGIASIGIVLMLIAVLGTVISIINECRGKSFKPILIVCIVVGVAVVIALIISNTSGGSTSNRKNKYDYVTNADGTRTWYETNNDHIVVID